MIVTFKLESADAINILEMAKTSNLQCLERWDQKLVEELASEDDHGTEEYITRQIQAHAQLREVIQTEINSMSGVPTI